MRRDFCAILYVMGKWKPYKTLNHESRCQGNLGKTPEQSLVPRTGSCRFLEDGEWAGQVIKAGMKEAETMHLYDTYL